MMMMKDSLNFKRIQSSQSFVVETNETCEVQSQLVPQTDLM